MSDDVPHPFSVEVHRLDKPVGSFGWMLRKNGKLMERSDRAHTSETRARESVMKALEAYLAPQFEKRR